MVANSRAGCPAPDVTDHEPLRRLYDVDGPALLAYLLRLTKGDAYWAQDILQETALRAWRNPEARNADRNWNRSWLFTVARRVMIDNVRAAQVRPTEYPDERIDKVPVVADEYNRLLDQRDVRSALLALPNHHRQVVLELYFRERTIEETAEKLGIPAGTVKSRAFYALRSLRPLLEENGFSARASDGRLRDAGTLKQAA
jgi:RNA polymerase sigma-70 factor, ECF subfamily